MHFRSATKVGFAVLLAVGAFFAVWYFLLGQGLRSNAYPIIADFKDAQDLTNGAQVRMAGVGVGIVDKISLTPDNQAQVRMLINKANKIPKGSGFIITSGGLIGEKFVSILPKMDENQNLTPDDVVQGQETIQIEDLLTKASQLASSSNDVIKEARLALSDTRIAIKSVTKILQDPMLESRYRNTLKNIERASARADQTAAQFQGMASNLNGIAQDARPRVNGMMASMQKSASNVQTLTDSLTGIISGDDVKTELGAALHNVKLATESMNRMTSNLEKLTGDQKMTSDLRETMENIRVASEQAKQATTAINDSVQNLTARYRKVLGGGSESPSKEKSTKRSPKGSVDLMQDLSPDRFRADLNGVLPIGQTLIFGGIRDFGETNHLNLQLGKPLKNGWTERYGLYDGYLGVGLDRGLGSRGWSFNLYRPNHLTADLYKIESMKGDNSLIFGFENLFRAVTPTIGVRIMR